MTSPLIEFTILITFLVYAWQGNVCLFIYITEGYMIPTVYGCH